MACNCKKKSTPIRTVIKKTSSSNSSINGKRNNLPSGRRVINRIIK